MFIQNWLLKTKLQEILWLTLCKEILKVVLRSSGGSWKFP